MAKFISKYSLWLAIIWTAIIFVLCSTPGKYIPTTSWLELLSFDKFVHASIFFVLIVLWLIASYFSSISVFKISLISALCITYGGLLEIMQSTLFSQRSGDWLDFIANSVGCGIGLLFFNKYKNRLNHWLNRLFEWLKIIERQFKICTFILL